VKQIKTGDRVQVVNVSEDDQKYLDKTGVAQQLVGIGYKDDDVLVFFDTGGVGYFKEDQLKKMDSDD
jgi:hypothetical protein